jgi:hypothetical protein
LGSRISIAAVFAVITLAGCAASRQQVVQNLDNTYIGKNVDALVGEWGPPTSTFRMNSGETAYVWVLSNEMGINVDQGRGVATDRSCKVNIVASPTGVVEKLTTVDASGTGGLFGMAGIDVHGSVCAHRLGIRAG